MITFDMAMAAIDRPEIADLNASPLSDHDLVNLVLQRSAIIRDRPRPHRYIKAWSKGNDAPLLELIDLIGRETLFKRAAAFIYLEYQQLRSIFDGRPPNKLADIGCGYALFDLFVARDFDTKLTLIDLETNDNRHFGFKSEGAAYTSLNAARELLVANGIPESSIDTRNPETDTLSDINDLDYAVSFISCGYHYPWETYRTFFEQALHDDGRVIIDIRAGQLAEALPGISEIGFARIVQKAANNSADRTMIVKTP